jgi:carbonic anhydrase
MMAMAPVAVAMLWPAGVQAQWRTAWSYEGAKGPAHWAELDPEYVACGGKEQSPIDIQETKKGDLPDLRFEFKSGPLHIINNGYTAVRVNYPAGNGNFLVVGAERYELTQFHFHHPSEELIRGKAYDMVVHLMYAASDGKMAGVAVLVNEGSENATVRELWKYMPKTAGKEHEIPGVQVNPAGLLPKNTAYYTYMGSVTAPPCTEGVKWFVLKSPVEFSSAEIGAFAKLYPHDARPVQPLNGRVVEESQ